MKSLFKTVFTIIIFTGLTRLLGFVFRIYLSRTIGAEALGIYQISFSIFMVLLTLVASGLPLIVSRMTAKFETQKDKQKEYEIVSSATIFSLVLSVVISLLVILLNKPISNIFTDSRCTLILIALLPALIFSSIYCVIRGNLWGKNNYIASCSAELFEQIVRMIICFVIFSGIFPTMSGEIGAAISLSIACLFSCTFVVVLYLKNGGKFYKPKGYKQIIKSSAPITGIRIISSLIQPVVSLIIPLMLVKAGYTQSQALSLFGVASGMTMPLLYIPLTLIGSLSYALVPDLSSAQAKNDTCYISSRITTSITFSMFVAFLIMPLFVGAGENIGLFFFDNLLCGNLLCKSAWVIVPLCITNITSSILNSVGLEIKSFKNYILGGIFMIILLFVLPKYVGIEALIYSMGTCFTISAIFNLRMIKKKVSKELKINRQFWLMFIFGLPSSAITSFLTNILSSFMPLFFNLAISCSLGAIFFVVLCIMFNVVDFNSMLNQIKFVKIFKKHKKIKQKV